MASSRSKLIQWLLPVLFLVMVMAPAHAAEPKPLLLAVLPQLPATDLHRNWTPFVERLSRELGIPIKLKLYEQMTVFEDDLRAGVPDVAFMTPFEAVIARQSSGYIPLVRSSHEIAGVVFVRKDSSVRSISDLAGQSIAFVGARNVCSILVRDDLVRAYRITMKQLFAGSRANVIKHVLLGRVAAGASLSTVLDRQPSEIRALLRIIYETKKIPPHPLSVHPRVPEPLREALRAAVLAMSKDPAGAELLQRIRMADPVPADYRRDYQNQETVDILKLSNEEK